MIVLTLYDGLNTPIDININKIVSYRICHGITQINTDNDVINVIESPEIIRRMLQESYVFTKFNT